MVRKRKILPLVLSLVVLYTLIRNFEYLYYSVGYHAIDELLFKELNHARNEVDKVIDAGEVNGVLLGLVRNSELEGLKKTIVQLEEKFNHQKYPYVFLNDEEFSLEFKEEIRKIVDVVEFGTIPRQHWSLPSWIKMNGRVSYGGLESYRHMCRFNSGFFYKHHLLDKYDYYWRIEPDVDFYCQLRYDPFKVMKAAKKKYGYAVLAYEEMETVNGLWEATVDFMKEYDIKPKHLFKMFKENGKDEYNGIHFWSNFEIGDLNWFRGKEYNDYFEFLDKRGGFFYERWGDAPVHSLAVGMFLKEEELHYFGDIGYRHIVKTCPQIRNFPSLDLKCDERCDLGNMRYDWVYKGIWGTSAANALRQIQALRNET